MSTYAMSSLNQATAATIHGLLTRGGLRQVDVAPALGLSQQAVSDRLRGRTPFTLVDLERLADLLQVDVRVLVQPGSVEPVGATA